VSDKLLLRNALLVDLDPPRVEAGDLRIRGGLIAERAPSLEPLGEAEVDLGGDVLLPGLVNAHTHLYSSLATGMPAPPVAGFEEALEKIWWPLDRSLTLEDVRAASISFARQWQGWV
jgi:cytosine/adenosine deaminase-related metal-dependent hydrolase